MTKISRFLLVSYRTIIFINRLIRLISIFLVILYRTSQLVNKKLLT